MNFYPFHVGDYTADTRHLSIIEDGAYRRLLDVYYTREAPLPADIAEVQRLVSARDKAERKAVESVLREFFTLTPEGWRNRRCDCEIAVHQDKRAKAIRSAKQRWDAVQTHKERSPNAMRTHSDGNANAERRQCYQDQDQDQEEALTPSVSAPPAASPAETAALLGLQAAQQGQPPPTRHGAIAVLLRSLGISTHSAHPQVHEWAEQGVNDEQLREAVAMAKQRKGKEPVPIAYLAPIVADIRSPKAKGPPGWATSDDGIARRARELGIPESRWPGTYAELRALCYERERAAA